MREQPDGHSVTETGAHPTTQQLVDTLDAWRFKRRKDVGPHILFRGPSGGTLRVLRSHMLSRADPVLVQKAARMLHVTDEQFWAGPPKDDDQPAARIDPAQATRRRTAPRDRNTSIVLGIHASCDRPLAFDQVVELAGGRISRAQVRTASSLLCRDNDLRRIRSGVYQWAGGLLAQPGLLSAPARELRIVHTEPAPAPADPERPMPVLAPGTAAAELAERVFPAGLRINAEVLADFVRWAQLTEKLIAHANAS
jgi:hypothetical protein